MLGPGNHALKNHCSEMFLHYPECLGNEKKQKASGGMS